MSETAAQFPYRGWRRAYRLGIVNGVLFATGVAFIDPVTVLPTFVSRLTDSDVAVGLVSAIGTGGWFLPQLLTASYLQARPYKRPLYVRAAFVRGVALLLATVSVLLLGARSAAGALAAFFLCYGLYSLGGGLSGVAFLDIVAKTVPGRRLGAFFGHRQFWGGLASVGCGLLVGAILGAEWLPFPYDYALLFALALANLAPGWAAFAAIREPAGQVGEPQRLAAYLRGAPGVVRGHREFRRLLLSRMMLGASGVALPFYILYCRRLLGVPEAAVGIYLSVQMAGSMAAVPLWAHLNDRRGPRTLVRSVAVLSVIVPAGALVVALAPITAALGRIALGAVFFLLAAATAGSFMGYTNYLLAIAPEERRPTYIGIMNTLFAVTTFLPLLGGVLLNLTSFAALFGVAAALAAVGAGMALRLPPPGRPEGS